ncbi:TPA: transcriptional repressor [Candidatus Poribacteria bacterium]|nr:transcriptional repressor [Candidatus Poribacteria bacterium]
MSTREDELIEVLRKSGYRTTRQRVAILKALRSSSTHPTAEELYSTVKSQIPNISLGTVYRSLDLFEKLGLLRKISLGEPPSRYNGNPKMHYHAICLSCGRVFDVDEPVPDDLGKRFSGKTGFEITGYKLEIYGYCKECRSKKPQ